MLHPICDNQQKTCPERQSNGSAKEKDRISSPLTRAFDTIEEIRVKWRHQQSLAPKSNPESQKANTFIVSFSEVEYAGHNDFQRIALQSG